MKEKRHAPMMIGGNGRLPPIPAVALWYALGKGWELELIEPTNREGLQKYYPHHHKIDIGNRELKIAIEIQGNSHHSLERKQQDAMKKERLELLGWKVIAITNQDALEKYTTFESLDTLLTSLMGY